MLRAAFAGAAPRRAIDLCAAPGSKATQLAAWLRGDPGAVLVANEPNGKRRRALRANLLRCGASGAVVTGVGGQEIGGLAPKAFDAVLVDAPCSSEGAVRSRGRAPRPPQRPAPGDL